MTLLEACRGFEASWISTAIRESKWGFAIIEMVHLLALAVLGAALFVTGLRAWGFLFKARHLGGITRDLGGLLIGAFTVMIASGLLLFADGPLRYYGNAAFRVKLLLIVAAVITGYLTHLTEARHRGTQGRPRAMKAMALLSGTLWLGAGIAGRMIGVL
jgi:hypothetical protein